MNIYGQVNKIITLYLEKTIKVVYCCLSNGNSRM